MTDQMIVYGDLNRDTPDQCELLLDNNPDVEAVFCVNDDMALGLYDVMRKRGLVPGKDIKVFGYDNTVAGSKAQPSLSTVGSDAIYLGKKAVSLMNRMLDGERVESVILPARFIRRNSFGRLLNSQDVIKDIAGIDSYFDVIFYRYLNSEKEDGSRLRMMFRSIAEGLLCFIDNPMEDGNDEKTLMRNVDTILDYHALDYVDMDNLVGHIERLYDVVCQKHSDIEKQFRFRMIVDNILRRVIYHMDYKVGNVRFERQNEINYMKMFVRDSLNFRKGNDTSYVALLRCVDWLDIQNAYLYIFEEPISHLYKEAFKIPENVNMKGFLKDGKIFTVPVNKQRVKIDNVVHNKVYGNGRRDYVLLPLFYNEIQYGLLLCDLSDKLYTNGEFLANQLGAAVHMVNLLHENEEIQQKLEEVVRSLRENNIALDHLSKQDSLTGIHNRRGYMDAAASLIEENRIMRRNTLVAYVDMNNLKQVNDVFGHEEGDYALRAIGRALTKALPENAVLARIGGDEFAV
ncbi:GGDEF domain-containing protein, partial [Eubacterium ruminantium]|uniref:substrate-binding and GGDEF domain-containing protein n=1 Tax=Eubacterium ruminantium TaxID=42322 RepID=UPI002478381F